MPNKKGPDTYKGYESPKSTGWPAPIRKEVRHVYGAYRRKNPDQPKARASRIAWSTARKKYPRQYAQHIRSGHEIKKEMSEHSWADKKIATQIVSDHHRSKEPKTRSGDLQKARQDYISSSPTVENELRKTYGK